MIIKIGKIRIDTKSRTERHREFLLNEIISLRAEIIDIVLQGEIRNRIPVKELKIKAKLIKKYSRRLKLLRI
jgi:hypothetical protein|tara:strand:+ start:162 stop:377 length:216 start_codon:yes stop_codon:yes gene_type:complete